LQERFSEVYMEIPVPVAPCGSSSLQNGSDQAFGERMWYQVIIAAILGKYG
jgi:hypothetical protein